MAQTYKKMNIDINAKPTDIVTAVQKDAQSRYLDISLLDNGLALNLTGHEVRIYGKKPDGTEFYNDGVITNATTGRCQFELTSQALSAVGIVEVQVLLFKDNTQILSTHPFTINVVKSLMSDGAIESSNEYGALVVLYQNLYEAYDLMTEMIQKIGVPKAIAKSLGLNTMFEVWDWLIDYMRKNSTAGIVDSINHIKTYTQNYGNSATKTGYLTQRLMYNTNLLENMNTEFISNLSKQNLPAGADGTFSRTVFEKATSVYAGNGNSKAYVFCKFIAPVSGIYHYTADVYSSPTTGYVYARKVITNLDMLADGGAASKFSVHEMSAAIDKLYKKSIGNSTSFSSETYFLGLDLGDVTDGRIMLLTHEYFQLITSSTRNFGFYFYAHKGELIMFAGNGSASTSSAKINNQKVTY